MNEYAYADRISGYIAGRLIRIYGRAKSVMPFDELNVLRYSRGMYLEIYGAVKKALRQLGAHYYAEYAAVSLTEAKKIITGKWIESYLLDYDPVTKYSFKNELERKASKLAESVLSQDKAERPAEIDAAMRAAARMTNQSVIGITDAAVKQAYEDRGITQVMWIAVNDRKRCKVCTERNGQIYNIGSVPAKPHPNCRCWTVPYQPAD